MGTKVLQMAEVKVAPENVIELLEDLLMGRNVAPASMYEKFVISTERKDGAFLVEVDDGSVYTIVVTRTK